MTDVFAAIGDVRLARVELHVPGRGPWYADCETESDDVPQPDDSGRVTITLGRLSLVGTITTSTEAFALGRKFRVVAGGGGWNKSAAPRAYHNDAGVKAQTVAEDAAREAGETLGVFAPAAERLARDYVRDASTYARTIEDAAGGADWFVAYDGTTAVGERDASDTDPEKVRVTDLDVQYQIAKLDVADPADVAVGNTLQSEALPAPAVIRGLVIVAESGRFDVEAHLDAAIDPTADLLASIVRRVMDRQLLGAYRYRVTTLAGERVNLQLINARAGLPLALSNVAMRTAPGVHAEVEPGTEVLVAFADGDRAYPFVCGFAARNEPGHSPTYLDLGGPGGTFLARVGDSVTVYFPPTMTVSGLLNGVPFTGVITVAQAATGLINTGCAKARGL